MRYCLMLCGEETAIQAAAKQILQDLGVTRIESESRDAGVWNTFFHSESSFDTNIDLPLSLDGLCAVALNPVEVAGPS